MDIVNIDGQNVPAWERPGSSDPAGKPHHVEEAVQEIRSQHDKFDTASLPQWQRSFLDPPLHKLAPELARLKKAVGEASKISADFKPEARARRQIEHVMPALLALGEGCARMIEDVAAQHAAAEAFAVQLPAPASSGNEALLFQLQAVELRSILRGMSEERREAYVKRQVELGNIVALQAVATSPDAIISTDTLEAIKRDRIKAMAPWIDRKRQDLRSLAAATYRTAWALYGLAAGHVRRALGVEPLRPEAMERALKHEHYIHSRGADPESVRRRAAYLAKAARR